MSLHHDTTDPQVIVDVSNVCRDSSLAPTGRAAAWSRFTRLVAAWHAFSPARIVAVAVADESLRFVLSPTDRREFERAQRSGTVYTVDRSADEEILREAERTGALVLSGDRFVGHRRRHPWIQGCTDRFFGWTEDAEHGLRIVPVEMGIAGAYSLSRGEEADLLRERHINPQRPDDLEVLLHAYRCTSPGCVPAQMFPDRLATPPARHEQRAVCPWCKSELQDLGPRQRGVEVVIELGGRELTRKVLGEGAELVLGRDDLPAVDDPEAAAALARVSRAHIRLRCQKGLLRVRDAGSTNGTAVARWNSNTRTLDRLEPLAAGQEAQLGHHDVVVMGEVRLRRSGQQFAIVDGDADTGRPARAAAATTLDEEASA
jgi:hypothetical protein